MHHFVDRRLNPRDKSLGNRQRFLKRTKAQVKKAVDDAVQGRSIVDASKGGAVTVPTDGISEPQFHHASSGGDRNRVLPGNKKFVTGDEVEKPQGGGKGGAGTDPTDSGGGEDSFTFVLSEDEFLDILFEDLELPDLVKASLKDTAAMEYRRAGYSTNGTTPNLNVLRTMRVSMGRRVALARPKLDEVKRLEETLTELDALADGDGNRAALRTEIVGKIEGLKRRQRAIAYIDPIDIRYNRFSPKPVPRAAAVMFCLMDVSASMGEREKELAKRFFILLHLFLKRKYEKVEIVFIRHTHEAKEVDEQEFFYGKETGGTMVSTAFMEMDKIRKARYPEVEWNVYCAQASDGDNASSDTAKCLALLRQAILPTTQFFAYIEIAGDSPNFMHAYAGGKELWRGYRELDGTAKNFAMKQVRSRADIYPVFRELFAKDRSGAAK